MDDTASPICLYEPRDPQEVALIEMALDGSGVQYRIENKRYAEAGRSPAIGDTRMRLIVRGDQELRARQLLAPVVAL